jgi:hypothetical protein
MTLVLVAVVVLWVLLIAFCVGLCRTAATSDRIAAEAFHGWRNRSR